LRHCCLEQPIHNKRFPPRRGLSDPTDAESLGDFSLRLSRSTDGGSLQSHRRGLGSSQVEVGAVEYISPGVQDAARTITPFRHKLR
jgi:hypothetical protein